MSRFDRFRSGCGGFHMILTGTPHDGKPKQRSFVIIACPGHGTHIPGMSAFLLARQLARGEIRQRGAPRCMGLINLESHLARPEGLDISMMTVAVDA